MPPRTKHGSVRWWNLVLGAIGLAIACYLTRSLVDVGLRKDFWGNITAELWGFLVAAGMGWVTYKRFLAERFSEAVPHFQDDALNELRVVALTLSAAVMLPQRLRSTLDDTLRTRLHDLADKLDRYVLFYGRFVELEELAHIDGCSHAARTLATLSPTAATSAFMAASSRKIFRLYCEATDLVALPRDAEVHDRLLQAMHHWTAEGIRERHGE